MEKLLGYYKEELAFLRDEARDFARRYPRVASGLMLSDQGSEDAQVNRLIQSVALLSARAHMRVGDDYGGFAGNLLDGLAPELLRPRPCAAIARFSAAWAEVADGSKELVASVAGRSLSFVPCELPRTEDPDVESVTFRAFDSLPLPGGEMWQGPTLALTLDRPVAERLRIFIDAEPALAARIRDVLAFGTCEVVALAEGKCVVPGGAISWAGPEGRLDPCATSWQANPAMDVLRDFFALPAAWSFFDIRLPTALADIGVREVRILLEPAGRWTSHHKAMERLEASHVLTRCAPVVNAKSMSFSFSDSAEQRSSVMLSPEATGDALLGVTSVHAANQLLPHFHSCPRDPAAHHPGYWVAYTGSRLHGGDGGDGNLSLVLIRDKQHTVSTSLAISALMCNGAWPQQIACGTPSAQLRCGREARAVAALVTAPTAFVARHAASDSLWHLLSQLRLGQVSLLSDDGSILREVLSLHAGQGHTANHAITGIVGVAQRAISHWLPGVFPPLLVRGTEITLTLDEDCFVGQGFHAWVYMLERFFATYAHINSFTRLVIHSQQTGKEIHACVPRSGTAPLI